MAADITKDQDMKKSCSANAFTGGRRMLSAYPGASGDIIFNHKIDDDL